MRNSIKTGVLSYGMSGSLFHCPFLNLHEGFELLGVVERSVKKAQQVYATIKSYDTVEAVFEDKDIELIVINTPSCTHFEFALKAIQSKKHVLVEKPFTVTSDEARTLYDEAEKQQVKIMPFQNRRYDSDFLSVKEVVESDRLGNLIEAHIRYDRYNLNISDNRYKEAALPGNGLLYNLGPHVIDAAIALFGMPDKWTKFKKVNRPNSRIDDFATVQLQYKNGLQVFLTVSLLVADAQKAFVLHGTKGSYVKNRCDAQEKQLKKGMLPSDPRFGLEQIGNEGILTTIENSEVKTEKITAEKSNYIQVFEDVFQSIRNEKRYPITKEQILKQIEILED